MIQTLWPQAPPTVRECSAAGVKRHIETLRGHCSPADGQFKEPIPQSVGVPFDRNPSDRGAESAWTLIIPAK